MLYEELQAVFYQTIDVCTLDSEINVAPEITIAPPLKNFYITILILFYTNLGIAIIFDFFCLQNFSKINKRTPTFIPESRVCSYLWHA